MVVEWQLCLDCSDVVENPTCENRVTECCRVVMSTAIAMDVPQVSSNNFSYL